jgi:signal peptidase I
VDGGADSLPRRVLSAIFGPLTWVNLRGWVLAIGCILVFRWTCIDIFKIPSGSMEPTLHGHPSYFLGDRVAVNKLAYGVRFPFNHLRLPWTNIELHYADRLLLKWGEPRRWDIVVFYSRRDDGPSTVLIKRIAGLPGERVRIANGGIEVDGERVEPPPELRDTLHYTAGPPDTEIARAMLAYAREEGYPAGLNPANPGVQRLIADLARLHRALDGRPPDSLPGEELRLLLQGVHSDSFSVMRQVVDMRHIEEGTFRYGILPDEEFSRVPEGHYLMLGDNSPNSRDGRCFGWIPREHILGRAFCIWWPVGRWRDFTGFTRTWQGLLLLWGVPLGLMAWEVCRRFVVCSWPVRASARGAGVDAGEHLLVNLTAFGLRVPFTNRKITSGREPRRGELVLYGVPAAAGVCLGRVAARAGDTVEVEGRSLRSAGAVWIVPRGDGEEADWLQPGTHTVPSDSYLILADAAPAVPDSRVLGWIAREELLGNVTAVWWPLNRRRRVDTGAPEI